MRAALAAALAALALLAAASVEAQQQQPAPARVAPRPPARVAPPALPPSAPPSIPGAEFSQPLVADLSSHLIAITTGFAGTELLLFGAIEGDGDVIVVVKGPPADTTVRRKGRVLGIWVNRESQTYAGAPSFYRVASSKPLAEIATPSLRENQEIGLDAIRLAPRRELSPERAVEFRAGLVRNKVAADLWGGDPGKINFLGNKLFRTTIDFPANVPTGLYDVRVLLVRDGQVVTAQTTPMAVSKVGFGADVYDFAHRRAALYGLLAVLIAIAAGWSASVAFRRD